jgi:hypothetical protein
MKLKEILKITIVVFSLFACQRADNEGKYPEVIRMYPEKTQVVKRSDLFELDRIIWLESASEMPIGGRDGLHLLKADERILMSSNSVGFFDQGGRFQQTMGDKGKGPGEYLTNSGIGSCQGKLRMLDRSGQKFLDYDQSGKYLGEYHLGIYPTSFTCLGDYTLVYMGYEKNDVSSNLLCYDKNMKLMHSFFEVDSEKVRYLNASSVTNFFHYNDSIRFMNPFEYTIWNIALQDDAFQVHPMYVVDFGEYNISKDFSDKSFPNVIEYYMELESSGFAHSIWSYWETEFNVFFIFEFKNQRLLGIYCKKSNRTIAVDQIQDDMMFRGNNLPVFASEALYYYPVEDQIYFVMEAWKFRELMQQTRESMNEEQWINYAHEMPAIINIYEKIEDTDNPVIFVFNLKEFEI